MKTRVRRKRNFRRRKSDLLENARLSAGAGAGGGRRFTADLGGSSDGSGGGRSGGGLGGKKRRVGFAGDDGGEGGLGGGGGGSGLGWNGVGVPSSSGGFSNHLEILDDDDDLY